MKIYAILLTTLLSHQAIAGDPKDPKGHGGFDHHGGINIDPRINVDPRINTSSNASAGSIAEANAHSDSNAIGIGGSAAGGTGTASAQGGQGVGSVSVTGNGNNVYRQVRQVPFAYSPGMVGSYSQFNCANSVSVGVSTPFGAAGVGVSDESDDCNRRSDSVRWQELGLAPTACQRMLVESEENQAALKASGLSCNDVVKTAVAVPVPAAVANNVQTPALDGYPTRDEMNRKFDTVFKKAVGK